MSTQPTPPYHYIANVASLITEAPQDSIVSRTIHKDEHVNVVLFAFAAGQALSEHTAATPATIFILSGEAEIGLAGETHQAQAGTWIHMPARLPHSVLAQTPVTMLLTMLQKAAS